MLRFGRQEDDKPQFSGWVDLGLQVSLTLALSVLLLGWFGHQLDKWLGSDPWLLIVGVLWGAVGGTVWMVFRVKHYAEEREREESARKESGGDEVRDRGRSDS